MGFIYLLGLIIAFFGLFDSNEKRGYVFTGVGIVICIVVFGYTKGLLWS